MFKLMGKKIFTILLREKFPYLDLCVRVSPYTTSGRKAMVPMFC